MTRRATAICTLALGLAGVAALSGCTRVGTGAGAEDAARASPVSSPRPAPGPPAAGDRDGRVADAPDPSAGPTGDAGTCLPSRTATAVELVNRHRQDRSLPPLRVDRRLVAAATAHAEDLAAHGLTGHVGSDGSEPAERVARAGYRWRLVGENVAAGVATPSLAVAGWMESTPHRRAILTGAFRDVGVAYVDAPGSSWNTWWVMVFGTPSSPGATLPRMPPCSPPG